MEADTGRVVWRRTRHDRRVQSSCLLRMQSGRGPRDSDPAALFLAILGYKKKTKMAMIHKKQWFFLVFLVAKFVIWRNSFFLNGEKGRFF
jgi:hypothetical protein